MNNAGKNKYNVLICGWNHHLEGAGWGYVCEKLKKTFHNNKSLVDMYTAYEYQVRNKINRPYVAFFHQVVSGYERSLKNILNSEIWKHNQNFLLGGFIFSKSQQSYLKSKGVIKPIRLVMHPTPMKVKKWSLKSFLNNQTFLHVGIHCRNVNFFLQVAKKRHNKEKYIFIAARERDYTKYLSLCQVAGIEVRSRLTKNEYNQALASSVVFMNLSDAAANNTVLECIARGTPILINNVGGIEDYLGENYPLYYSNKKQVGQIIDKIKNDPRILNRTNSYLLRRRHQFSMQKFLTEVRRGLAAMKNE